MLGMNEETLLHLANLARLDVPESERQTLLRDIENIVDFVKTVQQVETNNAEAKHDRINVYRADEVKVLEPVHDLIDDAAPLHKDHYVEVPKVLE